MIVSSCAVILLTPVSPVCVPGWFVLRSRVSTRSVAAIVPLTSSREAASAPGRRSGWCLVIAIAAGIGGRQPDVAPERVNRAREEHPMHAEMAAADDAVQDDARIRQRHEIA